MTTHRSTNTPIDQHDRETAIVLAAQTVADADPARTAVLEAKARRDPGFLDRLVAEARVIEQRTGRAVDLSAPSGRTAGPRRSRSRVEEVLEQMRERSGDPTVQAAGRNPNRNAPPPPSEIPPERDTRAWIERFEDEQDTDALAVELMSMEERAEAAVEQLALVDGPELDRQRARGGW